MNIPDETKAPRFGIAMWGCALSGLLLWAAFPPLGLWPLAWLAPIGWCLVIATEDLGSRPYRFIYATSFLHWLAVIQWIRLPHWSAHFGWLVLSAYLAIYVTAFVGLARHAVHRCRVPLWVACPVVWTGLELIRGYLLTGFSMALLGHTQVAWTQVIQIADFGGAYAVGMLIMIVSSGISCSLIRYRKSQSFTVKEHLPLLGAMGALMVALVYGSFSLSATPTITDSPSVKIALIQGSRDTTFTAADDPMVTLSHYRDLTREALVTNPDVDLIVWPESMHTAVWCKLTPPLAIPAEFDDQPDQFKHRVSVTSQLGQYEAGWFARQFGKPALVGCSAIELDDGPMRRYNSALAISKGGRVTGRYNKMHPVMFGEYVPLGKTFPWLYRLTPMGSGLEPGTEPLSVAARNISLSPSICYENTVPHLIRRQLRELIDNGSAPDALVTISNDGWFWGSSQLDLHLTCGVFRAVEARRPMLIAANTGFSAWIDAHGKVHGRGPRRQPGYVIAEVSRHDGTESLYLRFGDWLAGACAVCCLGLGVSAWRDRRRRKTAIKSE